MRNQIGTAFLPDRLRCVCCVLFLQWQWRDRRQNNDRGDDRGRVWSSGWSSRWSSGWSSSCISISISVITIAESFLFSRMLSLSCMRAFDSWMTLLFVFVPQRSCEDSVAMATGISIFCPAATRRSRICLDADQTRCRRLECVQGCLCAELVVSRWRVPRHGRRVAGRQTPRGRARPRTSGCGRWKCGRRRLRHPVARVDDGGMRRTRERWSTGEVPLSARVLNPAGNWASWWKWPTKNL